MIIIVFLSSAFSLSQSLFSLERTVWSWVVPARPRTVIRIHSGHFRKSDDSGCSPAHWIRITLATVSLPASQFPSLSAQHRHFQGVFENSEIYRESISEMLSRLRHVSLAVFSRILPLLPEPLIHCSSAQWDRKASDPGCTFKGSPAGLLMLNELPSTISNPIIWGSFLSALKCFWFLRTFFQIANILGCNKNHS